MSQINRADFSPSMGGYSGVKPFRYWCQKVLPLVYDDSLSYMELLSKVVDYLNKTIQDVATLEDNVQGLFEAYELLQNYVNNYFDNLDVQEEINNKLDSMVEDGTFDRLFLPYFEQFENEIAQMVTTQNDRISVLESRMDTFTNLPDGSTSGDAELEDIRVAYDGTVYPTAGDAVRAQASMAFSELEKLYYPVNYSYASDGFINFGISSSGKWTYSSAGTQRSYIIPLDEVGEVYVKASSENAIIAFLNSANPVVNENVDFAPNYNARITISPSQEKKYATKVELYNYISRKDVSNALFESWSVYVCVL